MEERKPGEEEKLAVWWDHSPEGDITGRLWCLKMRGQALLKVSHVAWPTNRSSKVPSLNGAGGGGRDVGQEALSQYICPTIYKPQADWHPPQHLAQGEETAYAELS